MAEIKPTRVLDATNNMENNSEQQYIEIGSNMYRGTKDGMKYTLIQTPDNKFRLVETLSDMSENADVSTGSLISSVKKEGHCDGMDDWMTQGSGSKHIKLMAAPSDSPACRGQGDELGNTVISPPDTSSDFKESVCVNSVEEMHPNIDRGSELTYTTLMPRKEKAEESLDSMCYSNPENDYYGCSSTFATPIAVRPTRYIRKPRTQTFPPGSPCSPIPRVRGAENRQRRPRQTAFQYMPQMLHSTPSSVSTTCTESQTSLGGVGDDTPSGDRIQMEYPRVPNNTPNSSEAVDAGNRDLFSLQWASHVTTRVKNYIPLDPRETHNEKERKRRLRIKNACQSMRSLLPSVTDKTDNATVFEQAVHFIAFVREAVGNGHDLEFLEEMCFV